MDFRKSSIPWTLLLGLTLSPWIVAGRQNKPVNDAVLHEAGRSGDEWLTYGLTQAVALMGGVGTVSSGNAGPGNTETPFSPKLLTFVFDGKAPLGDVVQP